MDWRCSCFQLLQRTRAVNVHRKSYCGCVCLVLWDRYLGEEEGHDLVSLGFAFWRAYGLFTTLCVLYLCRVSFSFHHDVSHSPWSPPCDIRMWAVISTVVQGAMCGQTTLLQPVPRYWTPLHRFCFPNTVNNSSVSAPRWCGLCQRQQLRQRQSGAREVSRDVVTPRKGQWQTPGHSSHGQEAESRPCFTNWSHWSTLRFTHSVTHTSICTLTCFCVLRCINTHYQSHSHIFA